MNGAVADHGGDPRGGERRSGKQHGEDRGPCGAASHVRLRGDLQAVRFEQGGRRQTLLVDPVARRFVRLEADRLDQLQRLGDGDAVLDRRLVSEAAAAGLLTHAPRPTRAGRWRLGGLLAKKLPGVPVDAAATWLAQRSGWLFSATAVVCWMSLVLATALAIGVYWERFSVQLPRLRIFLGTANWLPLAATLALTKLLHELAHAAACRRNGARCGEIGIMLLCGVPCPYCDVTDSWRIASRLRRAAIMLAGVYVELILAAVATILWCSTEQGRLHYAAMNVMIVCGISTLVFNLNPLMRYDGYHVLADLVDSVDLRTEASDAFASLVTGRLAGDGYAMPRAASPRTVGLAAYHIAAACYRVAVTVAIAIWMVHLAEAFALRPVGVTAASCLLLAVPAAALRRYVGMILGRRRWIGVGRSRRAVLGVMGAAAVFGLLAVPLPRAIEAPGVIDAADATAVYLPAAARIASVDAELGETVAAGQRLLLLHDAQLQAQLVALRGQAEVQRLRLSQLRRQAIDRPQLLGQWDSRLAAVQSLAAQQDAAQQACDRLAVVAPRPGVVLPPPPLVLQSGRADTTATGGQHASASSGTPASSVAPLLPRLSDAPGTERLDGSLLAAVGASATADAMWCRVGDPRCREAVLEVGASQRRWVRLGDRVAIRCDQSPADVVLATVTAIDTVDRTYHGALSHESRFRIACRLPQTAPAHWRIGATATARIRLPAEPLAVRLWKWWQETFGRG